MAKKGKLKLCKLVKNDYIKTSLKEYLEMIKNPKFVCSKCGRVAVEQKFLCKPVELD